MDKLINNIFTDLGKSVQVFGVKFYNIWTFC